MWIMFNCLFLRNNWGCIFWDLRCFRCLKTPASASFPLSRKILRFDISLSNMLQEIVMIYFIWAQCSLTLTRILLLTIFFPEPFFFYSLLASNGICLIPRLWKHSIVNWVNTWSIDVHFKSYSVTWWETGTFGIK